MTWIVEHADGSVTQHHERPGTAGIDRGKRRAKTPRIGDLGVERWLWSAKRWEPIGESLAARVDLAHAHAHGATAIAIAHATKALEARLILAGVAIDGLLAAEARASGQPLAELARIVAARAAEADTHELNRIAAKRAARKQRSK